MNAHMLYFLVTVALFAVTVAGFLAYSLHRSRKTSRASWPSLLAQLETVNRSGIERIAQDLINDSAEIRAENYARRLRPEDIWRLVGGMEGLESLERNSRVLIQMASYVHEWHPDADAAAEDLRLKARELAYHVSKLRAAEHAGKLDHWFANYAQHAVTTYYFMTRRVVALYENGPAPMYSEVQRVL
jgi:hypothetical protein